MKPSTDAGHGPRASRLLSFVGLSRLAGARLTNTPATLKTATEAAFATESPALPQPSGSTRIVASPLFVLVLACVFSIAAFAYLFNHQMTNVYGDGVARVNIARKVVDNPDSSLWQRYMQIGTPWLPLQTALMLPLVSNDGLWRTGAAGSIISMACYVIAAILLFLHARRLYATDPAQPIFALISVAIFLLNPSVLFMQATPMTELVFMAALIAVVFTLQRWVEVQTLSSLIVAGTATAIATLSRYEAWPLAVAASVLVAIVPRRRLPARARDAAIFLAIAAAGPVYWLWHNWAIFGNPLEFLQGPYSARGIYLENRVNLGWSAALVGNATLDVLTMLAAVAVCAGPLLLFLGAAGLLRTLIKSRRQFGRIAPTLLLLVPCLFHLAALYRGEIQVFPLSALGLLNVRYGLPHLLVLALFAPAAASLIGNARRRSATVIVCALVVFQYTYLLSEGPSQLAVYQEGLRNGVNTRPALELGRLAAFLDQAPPSPVILMHTGALGPVVPKAGLRFHDIVHEGTSRWHQLSHGIPSDVSTVIMRSGDQLDRTLRESAFPHQLEQEFRREYWKDGISVYKRAMEPRAR